MCKDSTFITPGQCSGTGLYTETPVCGQLSQPMVPMTYKTRVKWGPEGSHGKRMLRPIAQHLLGPNTINSTNTFLNDKRAMDVH